MAAVQKKQAAPSTAVAKVQDAGLPADLLEDVSQYAGLGVSTEASDRVIPFLVVLQDMSPYVKKRDPAYIEGAEPGMILQTATKKLVEGNVGVSFQPCYFAKMWVEWVPRASGGGFVGQHAERPDGARLVKYVGDDGREKSGWRTEEGNDLVETRYHYGHILDDEQNIVGAALVSFSSTGHTSSRQWMELMNQHKIRGVLAPSFFRSYRLRTNIKSNAQGEWFVWDISDEGWIANREVREAGHALYQAIDSGAVRAASEPDAATPDDGV